MYGTDIHSKRFIYIENDIDGESALIYSNASLKDFRQTFPGHVGTSYAKLHLAMKLNQQV